MITSSSATARSIRTGAMVFFQIADEQRKRNFPLIEYEVIHMTGSRPGWLQKFRRGFI